MRRSGEGEPVLLESIQRMEHALDVFAHCIHHKRKVPPFDARRDEAGNAYFWNPDPLNGVIPEPNGALGASASAVALGRLDAT